MRNKEQSASTVDPWLAFYRPRRQAALRLFCFPYAGGSAIAYRSWNEKLPNLVEVCPIQLPGRGARMAEAPFRDLRSMTQAVAKAILPYLDQPFAFFGHSMGALLGFELAHLLQDRHNLSPRHLFVSASNAPHKRPIEKVLSDLPDGELLSELHNLHGTPEAVLNNEELMKLILPLMRADFAVCESYVYEDKPRLNCSITAFGGLDDPDVRPEKIKAWEEQTTNSFALKMFSGDHFFINQQEPQILDDLSRELRRITADLS